MPPPWPSADDLWALAEKSEGIFIYASTLVKFVGDKYGQPRKKLQDALKAHTGLDILFEQVLNDAKEYPSFSIVLGAVVVLRDYPFIGVLPQLLQLDSTEDIRLALRGCGSILLIPESVDDDEDYVRPYHTSLFDFLKDPKRWKGQFFDVVECQETIVIGCIKLITCGSECNVGSLTYAYQNWCHHLHMVLSFGKDVTHIQSSLGQGVADLVMKVSLNFKDWVIAMEDHENLKRVRDDLRPAFIIIKVCLLEMHDVKPNILDIGKMDFKCISHPRG